MKTLDWIWSRTRLFWRIPPNFIYFCAMRVWVEATSGPYCGDCSSITMSEAISRFSRLYALGGSGKDEHFDSNRLRKS